MIRDEYCVSIVNGRSSWELWVMVCFGGNKAIVPMTYDMLRHVLEIMLSVPTISFKPGQLKEIGLVGSHSLFKS